MKDHLSEMHPFEMAFICEIKKTFDADDTSKPYYADVCLIDLIDEKSAEMKDIKVKFCEEAKQFAEKNKKVKNVGRNKKKEEGSKNTVEKKPAAKTKPTSTPFLKIGEAYSIAPES